MGSQGYGLNHGHNGHNGQIHISARKSVVIKADEKSEEVSLNITE